MSTKDEARGDRPSIGDLRVGVAALALVLTLRREMQWKWGPTALHIAPDELRARGPSPVRVVAVVAMLLIFELLPVLVGATLTVAAPPLSNDFPFWLARAFFLAAPSASIGVASCWLTLARQKLSSRARAHRPAARRVLARRAAIAALAGGEVALARHPDARDGAGCAGVGAGCHVVASRKSARPAIFFRGERAGESMRCVSRRERIVRARTQRTSREKSQKSPEKS